MQALLDDARAEDSMLYGLLAGDMKISELNALALSTALLHKGRVADAGFAANRLVHRNLASSAMVKKFADWNSLREQRELLFYTDAATPISADYLTRLHELKVQAESVEYFLAAQIPELRSLQPPDFSAIIPSIAQRLPADSVLIEVVWARPFLARALRGEDSWGMPHYVALLLFPDQRIVVQDLGPTADVDTGIVALRRALQSFASDPQVFARALYEKIVRPLSATLQGRTRLYLSLDGMLNLVPFDALHDGTDYLLGRMQFHYLTSGRDLLRTTSRQTAQPPLLLANPEFGQIDSQSSSQGPKSLYRQLSQLARLPGTEREAKALQPLLRVAALLGAQATEAAVRGVRAPRILHIATHGLFLEDTEFPIPLEHRGLRSVLVKRSKPAKLSSQLVAATDGSRWLPGGVGQLSRSALVLASAARRNLSRKTSEDGLLTADEARSLDLDGTQLVVLSACETGVGIISSGQGIYRLRRAFLVAGAETLVTSLWRVDDEATGELMGLYYGKLLDKQKPGDRLGAMVEAMQELRRWPGRSHPYYWAPFLVIGQDGPLRPQQLSHAQCRSG